MKAASLRNGRGGTSQAWILPDGRRLPHSRVSAKLASVFTRKINPIYRVSLIGRHVDILRTEFDLDLPSGYDIPLAFTFTNSTTVPEHYRAQLYVNGYQFGRYGECY